MLDLIGAIYRAALDPPLWPDVLNRIGDAVGGPQVVFGIYDPLNGLVNVQAPRTDPGIMRSLDDWLPSNPAMPCIANYLPGQVFCGADAVPLASFTATAFYQEWWRPAGFSTAPLVTNLFADGAPGHFAAHRKPNQAPFDGSQKRLFAALAQHLVRAAALQRRLHCLTIANDSALTVLDGLQQGVLLVDEQARILFVNRAAGALLDARDGLRLEAGALYACDDGDTQALHRLVASCANAHAATGYGGTVILRHRVGQLPLKVLVTPILPETAAVASTAPFSQRAVAMILLSDPGVEMQARARALRERFGFTQAEAAFALEIIKGDGRQASAHRLGISVGTARSHLSSIFGKTGARRQAELVRLLLLQ